MWRSDLPTSLLSEDKSNLIRSSLYTRHWRRVILVRRTTTLHYALLDLKTSESGDSQRVMGICCSLMYAPDFKHQRPPHLLSLSSRDTRGNTVQQVFLINSNGILLFLGGSFRGVNIIIIGFCTIAIWSSSTSDALSFFVRINLIADWIAIIIEKDDFLG